jgi:hypothetical protein
VRAEIVSLEVCKVLGAGLVQRPAMDELRNGEDAANFRRRLLYDVWTFFQMYSRSVAECHYRSSFIIHSRFQAVKRRRELTRLPPKRIHLREDGVDATLVSFALLVETSPRGL